MDLPKTHPIALRLPRRPEVVRGGGVGETWLLPVDQTDLVQMDYVFGGGMWVEGQPLQARYAMSQLRAGAGDMTAEAMDQRLDHYGASVRTSSVLSHSTLTVRCLRQHAADILPLVSAMLCQPHYEADRLATAAEQGLATWHINRRKVGTLSLEHLFANLLGPSHPLSHTLREEDFKQLSREDLTAYHERVLTPANCRLYLTGHIDDTLISLATAAPGAGSRHAGEAISPQTPGTPTADATQPYARQHEDVRPDFETVQASVRMGSKMPAATHPDTALLRLATLILGGYFGSRLMSEVRERRGLTYDIHGSNSTMPYHNAYIISTETPRAHAEDILTAVRSEMRRLAAQPVGADELRVARRYMLGEMVRTYEWGLDLPGALMRLAVEGRTLDDVLAESRAIARASSADIMRVARRYLDPGRFTECVVG